MKIKEMNIFLFYLNIKNININFNIYIIVKEYH